MAIGRIRSANLVQVKIIIDMSLSPVWVEYFATHGITSQHWSELGPGNAQDRVIMKFARDRGDVVFTHDLDFGNILAVTQALGPSVIQVRTQDPVPITVGDQVVAAIKEHEHYLARGALITIDIEKTRIRILPLVPGIKRRVPGD
jgi:predicted nuclease of predicted toxin-antitoxin system